MAAREGRQFGPANRALEFIGKATGLLDGKHQEPHVPITRITINLPPGAEPPADQIVEAAEYRELPGPSRELAEGTPNLLLSMNLCFALHSPFLSQTFSQLTTDSSPALHHSAETIS